MEDDCDHFLLICARCRSEDHAALLRDALAAQLPPGYAIRAVDCMAGCAHPTTVGFQAAGKAQYLFGDIVSSADLEALGAFARQYKTSSDGWTNASDRPLALFEKTLSRMPRVCLGPRS
ncbi:DUF1636 family protein [uncultured Roseobacter sp.]|uniref:DUF1636 family protein n=1 Tax=uncultured Roseobacter sp. TaxID=114847 RepID=UPI0026125EED|nr:DUF1636 family protein [uncultured Roseobacter sp.]